MREDVKPMEDESGDLAELGSASELTQGSFMPTFYEAINIKDRFEE